MSPDYLKQKNNEVANFTIFFYLLPVKANLLISLADFWFYFLFWFEFYNCFDLLVELKLYRDNLVVRNWQKNENFQ